MTSSSLLRRLSLLAAGSLAAAGLLSGCSVIDGLLPDPETRDSDTGEITEGGDTDVFSLREGDCLDDGSASEATEDTEVTDVPTVPCDEPHAWEVYSNVTLTEEEFPGDEEISTIAEEQCTAAFEEFAGISYEESVYVNTWYTPTAGSWATGDRVVNCLIGAQDGPVTGTLRGIAE